MFFIDKGAEISILVFGRLPGGWKRGDIKKIIINIDKPKNLLGPCPTQHETRTVGGRSTLREHTLSTWWLCTTVKTVVRNE